VTLGTSLTRLNRFDEAKEAFGRALQMGMGDARMHGGLYQVAFVEGDAAAMQQQLESLRGVPEEYIAADLQAGTAAYSGQWRQSKDFARRAIELAARVDVKEVAARYAAEQGLRAAAFGRCDEAKAYDAQSLALERDQVTLERVALGGAFCGDAQAQSLFDELAKQHPSDTLVNGLWSPLVRAAAELAHGNAAKAVEILELARAYEPAAEFWTHYLRGQAYLKLNKGSDAAAEFRQILSHRGESPLSVLYPLAQLGLARATLQTGDTSRAHEAYESFLNIWKDADADLPILQSAQKEYGNLKS
jgi:tetratricopeptide (TPR) repeat protein